MSCQNIALALGGGGARGIAHLGVIEELLTSGMGVERIVGISIGSLAGAMFAFEPDFATIQNRIIEYVQSDGFQEFQHRMMNSQGGEDHSANGERTWGRIKRLVKANLMCQQAVLRPSMLSDDVLQHAVDHLLPNADIAEATIPLSIVAIDLLAGERVILEKGAVRTAVRASSSIPGVFPPVKWENRLLCDIGTHNSLPTLATRSSRSSDGCLVAVDVSSELCEVSNCPSAVDVLIRANNIGERLFRSHVSDVADVVIRPDVGNIQWFDFSSPERLIELGRIAARQAASHINSSCCQT